MTTTRLRVTGLTHPGCVRDHNEDCIAVGRWVRAEPMSEPETVCLSGEDAPVCLVADGMGGHNAGEIASFYVASRVIQETHVLSGEAPVADLLVRVNGELVERMRASPDFDGMGSTVAGMAAQGSRAVLFNVGDSRIYRYRNGGLSQVSTDDAVSESGAPGSGEPGSMGEPPPSRVLTQALGGARRKLAILPHTRAVGLREGDVFLLCTDGLTHMVSLDAMEASIGGDDQGTVASLFQRAMKGGGADNISIILARVE